MYWTYFKKTPSSTGELSDKLSQEQENKERPRTSNFGETK